MREYPEGYEGDYNLLADAIDEHLARFIHEDDVAEVAIYEDAIWRAGIVANQAIRLVDACKMEAGPGRDRRISEALASLMSRVGIHAKEKEQE